MLGRTLARATLFLSFLDDAGDLRPGFSVLDEKKTIRNLGPVGRKTRRAHDIRFSLGLIAPVLSR
jgi:hypothetical protein